MGVQILLRLICITLSIYNGSHVLMARVARLRSKILFIFQQCGLQIVNYNKNEKKNIDTHITRFRSHYGVGHEAIAAMIKDLP